MPVLSGKKAMKSDITLKYKKGEQIIKEGDYGVSIYKVLKGRVQVFIESEGNEITLASLGRGEVIGEMVFLNKTAERRSASVRAAEDSVLEVWHPDMLSNEYDNMPPLLNYIAGQSIKNIIRMNKLVLQLTNTKQRQEKLKKTDPWASRRRFYRKKVDLDFTCRPFKAFPQRCITGLIKDISLGGAGLEVNTRNTIESPYKINDEFIINTCLRPGKEFLFPVRLVSKNKGKIPGTQYWGTSFTELTDQTKKTLNFFLMP